MKKSILLMLVLFCVCISATFAKPKEKKMYVNVQNASLKSGTSFFAKTLMQLKYGQEVLLINDDNEKWSVIKIDEQEGFINSGSLTKRKIKTSNFSASADELALAGKGFNEEIENSFKKNSKVNYVEVDKMENKEVDSENLFEFIKEGNLLGTELELNEENDD